MSKYIKIAFGFTLDTIIKSIVVWAIIAVIFGTIPPLGDTFIIMLVVGYITVIGHHLIEIVRV